MADSFSSVACSVARVSRLSRWLVILMLVWLMHFMLSCQWNISFLLLFNFLQIKALRFSWPIFSNWQLYSGSLTLQAPYTFNTKHQLLQNAFALNFFLFFFRYCHTALAAYCIAKIFFRTHFHGRVFSYICVGVFLNFCNQILNSISTNKATKPPKTQLCYLI